MAFEDLLNKLDRISKEEKPTKGDQRLVKLQEEVSRKIGVPLHGIPSNEEEIIKKATEAIRAKYPESITDVLPKVERPSLTGMSYAEIKKHSTVKEPKTAAKALVDALSKPAHSSITGMPYKEIREQHVETNQPVPLTDALEKALRIPGLFSQQALHTLSSGIVPKKLPPAETPAQKHAEYLGTAAGTALGVFGLGKALGAAGKALKPVVEPVVKKVTLKIADFAQKVPSAVKTGIGAGALATGAESIIGATHPELKERSLPAKAGASFRAGVGDVFSTAGSVAKWRDMEGIGETLTQKGESIKKGYEIQPQEFSWKSLLDPEFYAVNIARTAPFTASLIPAMYAGWKLGGTIGGKVGLGPFQKAILSSLAGAGLSRPLESALEAGDVYEETLARTNDEELANKAANEVYKKNLALFGLDAAQLAASFAPSPFKPVTNIERMALGAGRIAAGGLMEGGEEAVQDIFQRQAMGEKIVFDPHMQESFAIGTIFGMGMGSAGAIGDIIRERAKQKLPPEMRNIPIKETIQTPEGMGAVQEAVQEVTQEIEHAVRERVREKVPFELQSVSEDEIAQTPEGKKAIEESIQEVIQEIQTPKPEVQPEVTQSPQNQPQNESVSIEKEPPSMIIPEPIEEPVTEEPHKPEAETREFAVGDTVFVGNKPVKVIDTSNPSLITVENEAGTQFKVGRRAIKTKNPWDTMSYEEKSKKAQSVGWKPEKTSTKTKESKEEQKKATPDRTRNIFRGKHGMVRVEFPDSVHADLFAFWSKIKKVIKSGKTISDTGEKRLRQTLGLDNSANIGMLAKQYKDYVMDQVKDLPEGSTYKAPLFSEIPAKAQEETSVAEKIKESAKSKAETKKEPWEMRLEEFAKQPGATDVPKNSVLSINLDKENKNSLKRFRNKELEALAMVAGAPISGNKETKIKNILKAWNMRNKLADETLESLVNKYKDSELKEMLKSLKLGVTGNKQSKANILIKWREMVKQRGADEIAGAKHYIAVKKAMEEGKPVPEEVLEDYPELALRGREVWKIPVGEYYKIMRDKHKENILKLYRIPYYHRQQVKQALEAGKPVPKEVLKDYPNIESDEIPEVLKEIDPLLFNPMPEEWTLTQDEYIKESKKWGTKLSVQELKDIHARMVAIAVRDGKNVPQKVIDSLDKPVEEIELAGKKILTETPVEPIAVDAEELYQKGYEIESSGGKHKPANFNLDSYVKGVEKAKQELGTADQKVENKFEVGDIVEATHGPGKYKVTKVPNDSRYVIGVALEVGGTSTDKQEKPISTELFRKVKEEKPKAEKPTKGLLETQLEEFTEKDEELIEELIRKLDELQDRDPYDPDKVRALQQLGVKSTGVRLNDAEETGMLRYMLAKGEITQEEWDKHVQHLIDTNRVKDKSILGKRQQTIDTSAKKQVEEKPTVIVRNRFEASPEELAADYKARGYSAQTAYGQFVKDRGLKPELDAKDFIKIFNAVEPQRFNEIEIQGKIKPTHILKENTGTLDRKIQILEETDTFIKWVDERGTVGSTPKQFIKKIEPISKQTEPPKEKQQKTEPIKEEEVEKETPTENLEQISLIDTIKGKAINLADLATYPNSSYIAKITGLHPRFKFSRDFLKKTFRDELEYGRVLQDINPGDIMEFSLQQGKRQSPERKYYVVYNVEDKSLQLKLVNIDKIREHFQGKKEITVPGTKEESVKSYEGAAANERIRADENAEGSDVGKPIQAEFTGLDHRLSLRDVKDGKYERLIVTRGKSLDEEKGYAVSENIGKVLRPHQKDGVNLAVAAIDNYGGFVLADGTGAGKTMQELATADYYAKKGHSVLIVTPNKGIINTAFKGDAKLLGITVQELSGNNQEVKPGVISVTTYKSLNKLTNNPEYVIFDEAHYLKNSGTKQSQRGLRLARKAKGVLYASATPIDKAEHIFYLEKLGIFEKRHPTSIMQDLGYEKEKRTIRTKQGERTIYTWERTVSQEEAAKRLENFFDELADLGLLIKREVSMDKVDVYFNTIKLPQEAHKQLEDIEEFYEQKYKNGLAGLAKAQMLMAQRRFQEPHKIDEVYKYAMQELEAGRQVVIFASRVEDSELVEEAKIRTPQGEWITIDRVVHDKSEGTLKTLAERFKKEGYETANIFGAKTVKSEVRKFQEGKAKIALVTPQKGGAGLSLDDVKGIAPRTMIIVTSPLSGVENVQIAGRINRLNTKSRSKIVYLLADTSVDRWNKDIIAYKMKVLNAAVKGDIGKLEIQEGQEPEQPTPGESVEKFTQEELNNPFFMRRIREIASNMAYEKAGIPLEKSVTELTDEEAKDFRFYVNNIKQNIIDGDRPEIIKQIREEWEAQKADEEYIKALEDSWEKEDWEVPQDIYVARGNVAKDKAIEEHKQAVKQALEAGKPVPKEVLKDYPELAQKAEKKEKQVDLPIEVSPDDIPIELAKRAYAGTSFVPDERARQEQQGYVDHIKAVYEELKPLAKTEEQEAMLKKELQRYRDNYLTRYKDLLVAKSQVLSPMIAGPSKFPTAKNEKALNAERKKLEALLEWQKKALDAIKKKIAPETSKVISSDDENAIELLKKKIADAERMQDMMKKTNAIVRKKGLTDEERVAQMVEIGLKEVTARKILEPDFAGRKGFPSYMLKNNNANIRRIKQRIEELTRQRAQETSEFEYEGARIVDNVEDNRVQIFFDGKPDEAFRKQLRGRGFVWAPSVEAWQRKRSESALNIAKELVGKKFGQKEETKPESEPKPVVVTKKPVVNVWQEEYERLIKKGYSHESATINADAKIENIKRYRLPEKQEKIALETIKRGNGEQLESGLIQYPLNSADASAVDWNARLKGFVANKDGSWMHVEFIKMRNALFVNSEPVSIEKPQKVQSFAEQLDKKKIKEEEEPAWIRQLSEQLEPYSKPQKMPTLAQLVPKGVGKFIETDNFMGPQNWVLKKDIIPKAMQNRLKTATGGKANISEEKVQALLEDQAADEYDLIPIAILNDEIVLLTEKDKSELGYSKSPQIYAANAKQYFYLAEKIGLTFRANGGSRSQLAETIFGLFAKKTKVGAIAPVYRHVIKKTCGTELTVDKVKKALEYKKKVRAPKQAEETYALPKKAAAKKKKPKPDPLDFITDPEEYLDKLSAKTSRQISEKISKALKTVLRPGKIQRGTRGARGIFNRFTKVGRIKKSKIDNWRTVGHELGHAVEHNGKFKPYGPEMWAIAEKFYPEPIPKGKKTSEGFADFLVLWFVDNDTAREIAPKTAEKLDAFLDANPELHAVFDECMTIAVNDLEGSALERIGEDILKPGERYKATIGEEYEVPGAKRLAFKLWDFTIPLKDLYKAAVKQGYSGLDPSKLAAISGMVEDQAINIFENPARDKAGRFLIPNQKRSLKEIVEAADKAYSGGIQIMDRVYHAMRYLERYERGFKDAPKPKKEYERALKEAKEKFPKIIELVEEYSEVLSETILRLLVRYEVISEQTAEKVRRGSKYYLPLYHVGKPSVMGAESKRRAAGQPVQKYKGHSTATLTFLEATMLKLHDTILAVEINRIMQAIEGTLKDEKGKSRKDMGLFGEIIERPVVARTIAGKQLLNQIEADSIFDTMGIEDENRIFRLFMPGGIKDISTVEPIIMVRHGNKQTFIRLAPDIYEAVLSLKPPTINLVAKGLAYLAQISRFGALFNVRYLTNAIARDVVGSGIQSKTPGRSMLWGYLKGALKSAGGDPELMSLYIQSGAYGSSVQEALNSMVRSSYSGGLFSTPVPGWKRTTTNAFVRVVRFPWELLRVTEEASRVSEFEAVLKKELGKLNMTIDELKQGNIPEEAAKEVEKILAEAAYASREIVVNFGLHGTNEEFRRYARTVPFLQGGIQGIYRGYRQVKDKPLHTLKQWMIYVLPLTLIAWALSHEHDRYRDMPSEARDGYWWIPMDEHGEFFVAIAKPYEYLLPAIMLERFFDWIINTQDSNRRKPFEDIGSALGKTFGVPVVSMLLQTILELWKNETYYGAPIVPVREQNLEKTLQHGPNTTKAAIKLSEIMAFFLGEKGPSPRQIDYFMRGSLGGVGKTTMNIASIFVDKQVPGAEKRTGIEYIPIIGSVLYGPEESGSRIVDRFYNDYEEAQKLWNSYLERKKRGVPQRKLSDKELQLIRAIPAMKAIANDLAEKRGELRQLNHNKDISPEQKRVANLRFNWYSRVAAGFLYGQLTPEIPKGANMTNVQAQDILDYLDHLTQQAMIRAMKTPGGPV